MNKLILTLVAAAPLALGAIPVQAASGARDAPAARAATAICAAFQNNFGIAGDTFKTWQAKSIGANAKMESAVKANDKVLLSMALSEARLAMTEMVGTMAEGVAILEGRPKCFDAETTKEFKAAYEVLRVKSDQFLEDTALD